MIAMLALAISALGGIGSLVCFIVVVIHFFKSDQSGLGIACILLLFCGIGALIAFVKGWIDGLGTVMYVWTACIVLSVVANLAAQAMQ